MTVKLIRFSSGEDVVANVVDESDNSISIKNALVTIPTQNGQIGFAPWSPIMDPDENVVTISKNFVVYVTNPASQVVDQHNSIFSKVLVPEKKIIV